MIADQTVKDATTEYLSHRGEQPYRVLRGGSELWENHAHAMRAALTVALRAHAQGSSPALRAPEADAGEEAVAPRVPKVRTGHHRNKEEAARLQSLVNEKYSSPTAARMRAPPAASADVVLEVLQAARDYIWGTADKDELPEHWTIIKVIDALLSQRQSTGGASFMATGRAGDPSHPSDSATMDGGPAT